MNGIRRHPASRAALGIARHAWLLCCALLLPPASANVNDLSAEWRINGNGFPGPLRLVQSANGALTGTMYGDTLTGRYAPGERVAVLLRGPANQPIQAFVAEISGDGRSMSGSLYTLNTHSAGGSLSRNVFSFTARREASGDPPNPGQPQRAAGPQTLGSSLTLNGNGYVGPLLLSQAVDGTLTGTVYGQRLEGHYAPGTGSVAFIRHDGNRGPFQFFAGDVTAAGISGQFYALTDGAGASTSRIRYAWQTAPTPAVRSLTPQEALFHPKAPLVFGPPAPAPQPATRRRINADGTLDTVGRAQQPLASVTPLMWQPGVTLRVKLMGGTARVRSKVREFAEQWTQHANIRFAWVDSGPAEIRVAFDPGGSWSAVGTEALAVPFDFATMNFGWFDDSTSDVELRRVTLHEFGHALGMVHEHQSPAAGIAWNRSQVYAVCASQNPPWDQATCDRNFFDQYSAASTNFSAYDPLSVMQYRVPASLTIDGVGARGGDDLSATDKRFASLWYPFPTTQQGMLRTGDDCDEIDFRVEPGRGQPGAVLFDFALAPPVTWFKAISVPVGGNQHAYIGIQDAQTQAWPVPFANIDRARPIGFTKAKVLGVHTLLPFRWDVMPALQDGDRVTLRWKRDRC